MSNPDDKTLALDVAHGAFTSSQDVGPYRLLQRLGAGGMGEVWLAEQREPVRRRVALKFVRAGLQGADAQVRFESERQALALMDHPGIARIFDAGVLSDGRPFFAMEYVRGGSITGYCDQHELDLEERIRLFVRVCNAVQHAHHKAILHRDLKPSNILVSEHEGEEAVKVIDFGIAKAMTSSLTDETLHTRVGQVMGTPRYMSPEQADPFSNDIDTRSDVYSLGVVLYELLTGSVPYDPSEVEEFARRGQATATSATRPSTQARRIDPDVAKARRCADPPHLAKSLRGELDWILLKAVELEPKRRYGSPNELAQDLERFLDKRPVEAGPPGRWYRARMFYLRHSLAVTAALAIVLAVFLGGTLALFGFLSARRSAVEAEQQAQAASAVSGFLTGLFQGADPRQTGGRDVTARELLDRGVETLEGSLDEAPASRAAIVATLSEVYRELGEDDEARALAEQAVELRRRQNPPDPVALAGSLIALGDLLRDMDDSESAESRFLEARALLGPFSAQHWELHAKLKNDLGLAAQDLDRLDEAIALFEESLELRRRFAPTRSLSAATGLHNLAGALFAKGGEENRERAIAMEQEALSIRRELLPETHPRVASALAALAGYYGDSGRVDEAEALLTDALRIRRSLGVLDDRTASVLQDVGWLRFQQRDYEASETAYREALEMVAESAGGESVRFALITNELGMLKEELGSLEEAERLYRESLRARRAVYSAPHPFLHNLENKLARVLIEQGRSVEAGPLVEAAVAGYTEVRGNDHPLTIASKTTRLHWLLEQGRAGDALQDGAELLEVVDDSLQRGRIELVRALAHEVGGDLDAAVDTARRAVETLVDVSPRFRLDLARAQAHHARLLAANGERASARDTAEQALAGFEIVGGEHDLAEIAAGIAQSAETPTPEA